VVVRPTTSKLLLSGCWAARKKQLVSGDGDRHWQAACLWVLEQKAAGAASFGVGCSLWLAVAPSAANSYSSQAGGAS
jgi:hypothetical protein